MSLASWFSASPLHRASALNKTRRQPAHSRPSLEHLEERTLLDASSGLIGGATGNLNLNNNFNLASSGNILPVPGFGNSSIANGANPQQSLGFTGLAESAAGAQAATSSFLAQGQLYSQFRLFAVNSQGPDYERVQDILLAYMAPANGFGSGTQPNAPWKPNAYNLGLANGQFGYSTQTDMGFSAGATPFVRRGVSQASRSLPRDQNPARNRDQNPPLNQEEESAEMPDELAPKRNLRQPEQAPQDPKDEDISDMNEDSKALTEQQASEKQAPIETVTQEDGSLPDSLWLSALAPAPMAGLVAGLPGIAAAPEGGEVSGEAGGEAAE